MRHLFIWSIRAVTVSLGNNQSAGDRFLIIKTFSSRIVLRISPFYCVRFMGIWYITFINDFSSSFFFFLSFFLYSVDWCISFRVLVRRNAMRTMPVCSVCVYECALCCASRRKNDKNLLRHEFESNEPNSFERIICLCALLSFVYVCVSRARWFHSHLCLRRRIPRVRMLCV